MGLGLNHPKAAIVPLQWQRGSFSLSLSLSRARALSLSVSLSLSLSVSLSLSLSFSLSVFLCHTPESEDNEISTRSKKTANRAFWRF